MHPLIDYNFISLYDIEKKTIKNIEAIHFFFIHDLSTKYFRKDEQQYQLLRIWDFPIDKNLRRLLNLTIKLPLTSFTFEIQI